MPYKDPARRREYQLKKWRQLPPDIKKKRRRIAYENMLKRQGRTRHHIWGVRKPIRFKTLSKHGITQEIYEQMLAIQRGVCAICQGSPNKNKHLYIDHDHTTGKNRGLLCHMCNLAIERLEKIPDWSIMALNYLSRFRLVL